MADMKIVNLVVTTDLKHNLQLEKIASTLHNVEYNPEQFPGLVYRLDDPKTATLLFTSGKANCTGAKNLEDVRKAVDTISEKLRKLGVKVYKNLEIVVQNIVATADLGGELNLNEVAMGLGLENVEYEPEQFPGLVYRVKEPRVVMLLFSSSKIVCTGGKNTEDVSTAVEKVSKKLTSMGLLH